MVRVTHIPPTCPPTSALQDSLRLFYALSYFLTLRDCVHRSSGPASPRRFEFAIGKLARRFPISWS